MQLIRTFMKNSCNFLWLLCKPSQVTLQALFGPKNYYEHAYTRQKSFSQQARNQCNSHQPNDQRFESSSSHGKRFLAHKGEKGHSNIFLKLLQAIPVVWCLTGKPKGEKEADEFGHSASFFAAQLLQYMNTLLMSKSQINFSLLLCQLMKKEKSQEGKKYDEIIKMFRCWRWKLTKRVALKPQKTAKLTQQH